MVLRRAGALVYQAVPTKNLVRVFVILHHERREIVHFNATYHPTAE
jgi:hypothetical protein